MNLDRVGREDKCDKNRLCGILKELIKMRTQNEKLNEEAVSHNL